MGGLGVASGWYTQSLLLFLFFPLFFGGGGYLYNFLWIHFFSGESKASNDLRSVGGLQVASGWLMQTPLGLFVLASGWLARSQWVAYVNYIGFICYS